MTDEFTASGEVPVLHQRLPAGDPVASAQIAELLLPWLSQRMRRIYWNVRDPHMLDTAVIDALRGYLKNPSSYHPEALPLHKYLLMAAKGDLRNAQRQDVRVAGRNETLEKNLVELGLCTTEQLIDTPGLEQLVKRFLPDPMDRQIFSLMAHGIRATEEFSRVLGIDHHPVAEQRHTVKMCKDRILAKLRRAARDERLERDEKL